MDLLQTILQTCRAEKYNDNFKNNGIDTFTLKLLNDEDLKLIGVEEANIRELIIKHVSNLQIPAEKKVDAVVDRQYASTVLSTMSVHLVKHFAKLTYALKREDVDLCYVELTPAVDCLENCLASLEHKLSELEEKVFKTEERKRKRKYQILFPTIAVTAVVLFACAKYFKSVKLFY